MTPAAEGKLQTYLNGRLIGMRTNRYSWWVHWRELADYFLPRRYKWIITPNQQTRGSPINQHILDSTGCLAARNLAAGLMSGKTSPTRPWFGLRFGKTTSAETTPVSLWLSECEAKLRRVFHESNFYNAIATFYYDLVIFGTAVIIIYEDYENVINCYNPCAGEYYVDIDGTYRPCVLYREFTFTVSALVERFGYDNCSRMVRQLYDQPSGAGLTREVIVAHAIEPNSDGRADGLVSKHFRFREVYWEWAGSESPQGGAAYPPAFLKVAGFHEQPQATVRWDLVSNDPYGRSVAMDALPDQRQLQLEQRRKAQAIEKTVNPPMVADIQLKNQPASTIPGGITYVTNFAATGRAGFASAYETRFDIAGLVEDLNECRERLKYTFYNHLFQPISQFETRSNVTAVEIDQRRAESLIMLGPVFDRIDNEGLRVILDRVWGICSRAGILPPPPPGLAGLDLQVEFVSMLANAQDAMQAASIERVLGLAGNLAGVNPAIMDNLDTDYALDKYSNLLGNDPRIIRMPEQVAQMRQERQQSQQQAQQAAIAEQLAKGAKTLSETDVGGDNALTALTGGLRQ